MALDRRGFTLGLLALTAACAARGAGRAWWPVFRRRFLADDGRVVDNGNGGVSHSEGQGYGLAFALAAGDRDSFAAIATWTQGHLARADTALHAWRYDPAAATPIADRNNATDGDLLIAWSLARAARRWGERGWAERSAAIRAAIRRDCVIGRFGHALLLPGAVGFAGADTVTLNPSYFVWPALDAFARLDGAATWRPVIAGCGQVARLARFGAARLPTDWVSMTGADALAPAPGRPPRFGFDAIRVPLYAALGGRADLTAEVAAFWRARRVTGRPLPAWVDVTTGAEAPFALSPGGDAVAARLLGAAAPSTLSDDYYAASLQMLAAGAM